MTMGSIKVSNNRRKKLLKNKNREIIYYHIKSNPGCTISVMSKSLNIAENTVRYHILKLKEMHEIKIVKTGKIYHLFIYSTLLNNIDQNIISYMDNNVNKKIFEEMLYRHEITNKELSKKLLINKSLIHRHLNKLIRARLIVFKKYGKNIYYSIDSDTKNHYQWSANVK